MTHTKFVRALGLAGVLLSPAAISPLAQDGVKRTDVQTADLSIPGRQVVQQFVEFQPGVVAEKHTHPGEEVGVVLEGILLLEVAGKPSFTLKAGQGFVVPPNAVHGGTNTSRGVTRLLTTYIVDKTKPLRGPAPSR